MTSSGLLRGRWFAKGEPISELGGIDGDENDKAASNVVDNDNTFDASKIKVLKQKMELLGISLDNSYDKELYGEVGANARSYGQIAKESLGLKPVGPKSNHP
ncbi:hypothetical protein RJT34_12329 [Clitoria ternatea]|uniref:Uncharacterized protein n=1 Tax=Clitoria ternatea TaxID=43366 RepID=A0AAN9JLK3_CLITE